MEVFTKLPNDLQIKTYRIFAHYYHWQWYRKVMRWFKQRRVGLLLKHWSEVPAETISLLKKNNTVFAESYYRHFVINKPYYHTLPRLESFFTYVILELYDII